MRKDIAPGTTYGRLTVIERTDEKKRAYFIYRCKCKCGKEILVRSDMLRSGEVKSCGCLHDELFASNQAKAYAKNFVDGTHVGKIKNQTIQRNNTSGVRGVRWHKGLCKWQVSIAFKCKSYHLGYYDNMGDASKVRALAEKARLSDFEIWYKDFKSNN